jgi:peptide/nickel transport system substrate-binding protein
MGPFSEQGEQRVRRRFRAGRKVIATLCGAAALALVVAACSSGNSPSSSNAGGQKVAGGVATYALQPSNTPNYIFPFTSAQYISITNLNEFGYLMYRPLYWFGTGARPTLNTALSVAQQPAYNGRQVTIKLKGWKWSNGETVNSTDVMFWINMMKAVGSKDWGGFVPNGFPSNVSDIKAVSPTEITMTMNKAFSPTWFTYNELSQITPMPVAWDRIASGPSDCATKVSDCTAVYSYLDSQSKAMSSWATSPIWGVVDGPWKLTAFNPDGDSTFVPNKSYSGPIKPTLSEFKEVGFTTEQAEYNVLRAGASGGSQTIDFGYLPTTDAPNKPANAAAGANPVQGYILTPLSTWGINYFPVNYQSTTGNGPILKQLYFRQVLENLVDQQAVISGPLHGYGTVTPGPVPQFPTTSYISPTLESGDPFTFSISQATQALTSNGWKVVPNGTTYCVTPSKCGAGVKAGQKLVFSLPYNTGINWIASEMTELQSNASQVGIKINLEPQPFNQVIATAAGNCVVSGTSCKWDMGNWGLGWSFAPDFYPTGETLFMSGSGANSGGYSDATNDTMINATLTATDTSSLISWENYLSSKIPVIWQPNGVYELSEVANSLQGVNPQSSTLTINPEDWYFTK